MSTSPPASPNAEIIRILSLVAAQLEARHLLAVLDGDEAKAKAYGFRSRATANALRVIRRLSEPIIDPEDLLQLTGIGKGTVGRIREILETGTLEELREPDPETEARLAGIRDLLGVVNIGLVTVRKLVREHGIADVPSLQRAIEEGRVRVNPKVALGLRYYGRVDTHIPREQTEAAEEILYRAGVDCGLEIRICGSYRRGRPYSSDIDVLVYSREYPEEVPDPSPLVGLVERLTEMGFLTDAMTNRQATHKWLGFGHLPDSEMYYRIDLLWIPYQSLATAMTYYTGPYELNSHMRGIARRRGLKLNEFRYLRLSADGRQEAVYPESEAEVFQMVGMSYLTPVERDSYRS